MVSIAQTLSDIDDVFGLSNGSHFESPSEVYEYFTSANINSMFPYSEQSFSQDELTEFADLIIENEYHCAFEEVLFDSVE